MVPLFLYIVFFPFFTALRPVRQTSLQHGSQDPRIQADHGRHLRPKASSLSTVSVDCRDRAYTCSCTISITSQVRESRSLAPGDDEGNHPRRSTAATLFPPSPLSLFLFFFLMSLFYKKPSYPTRKTLHTKPTHHRRLVLSPNVPSPQKQESSCRCAVQCSAVVVIWPRRKRYLTDLELVGLILASGQWEAGMGGGWLVGGAVGALLGICGLGWVMVVTYVRTFACTYIYIPTLPTTYIYT